MCYLIYLSFCLRQTFMNNEAANASFHVGRSFITLHYRVAYGTFMYHPNQDSTFLILGNEETRGERQNEQTVRLPSHVLQFLLDHHIPSSLSEEHNPQQIISVGFQLHQCLVWGRDYISGYTLVLQLTSRIQSFSTRSDNSKAKHLEWSTVHLLILL